MAHYAANFTTTSQNKPSVLEILAQDSLSEVIYPVIRTLISATSYPSLGHYSIFQYHEEILLAVNGILQYYYFKNFDASFSENFYGLKRVFRDDRPLSESYKIFCTSIVTLVPYLKKKIEDRHNYYMTQEVEGALQNGFTDRMKKMFVQIYPWLRSGWNIWLVVNYLKYMAGIAESQLPVLHLLNLKLIYSPEIENAHFWTQMFRGNLSGGDFCKGVLKHLVMSCLEGLAFYTQFAHSINSIIPNFSIKALPKILAPRADNKSKDFTEKCPLCKQYWKLPTVLPVSGYVFCFSCILKHLKEHQNCPVTKIPARPLDIVRIFEED